MIQVGPYKGWVAHFETEEREQKIPRTFGQKALIISGLALSVGLHIGSYFLKGRVFPIVTRVGGIGVLLVSSLYFHQTRPSVHKTVEQEEIYKEFRQGKFRYRIYRKEIPLGCKRDPNRFDEMNGKLYGAANIRAESTFGKANYEPPITINAGERLLEGKKVMIFQDGILIPQFDLLKNIFNQLHSQT